MAISPLSTGAVIGYYVYKQKSEGTACLGIGMYSNITPLFDRLYITRDAARRAARKLTDAQRKVDRNSPWSYDFSAARQSDRHLFAQTVTA